MKNCTHFPFFINGFQHEMAKSVLVNKADGTLVVPIVNLYGGFGSRSKLFTTMLLLVVGLFLTPNLSWGQTTNLVSWDFTTNISNANYASNTTNQNAARTSDLTNTTLSTI